MERVRFEPYVGNGWILTVIKRYRLVSGNTKPFNIYHLVQGGLCIDPLIDWYVPLVPSSILWYDEPSGDSITHHATLSD